MSAPASATRIEEDALGEVHVPADHLWGAQTQRSRENFPIGVDRFRFTRPVIRAFGLLKQAAARANRQLGQLPPDKAALIEAAAQEVIDGDAGRRVPPGRVPDRLRHADQHERQRGDRQPRHPARRRNIGRSQGRTTRRQTPHPPERRREPQPVLQRRLPHRDAHRRRRADRRPPAPRRPRPARHARRQGPRLCRHRHDRAHPPAGRHAADRRADDLRLGRPARPGRRLRRRRAARAAANWRSAAPPSAPASTPTPASAPPSQASSPPPPASASSRPRTSSPRSPGTRRWSTPPPRCARWPAR